jgi:hypothetical protein
MNIILSASRLSLDSIIHQRTNRLVFGLLRTMSLTASHPNLPERVRALIDKVQLASSKGTSEKDQAAIDGWLTRLSSGAETASDLKSIDNELLPRTYLVSNQLTVADVALYGVLHPTIVRPDIKSIQVRINDHASPSFPRLRTTRYLL